MIKLIAFDLDGVLVESKEIHYKALNDALELVDKKYIISLEDHLKVFDGLPTVKKLEKLTLTKKLPIDEYKTIWNNKQKLTLDYIKQTPKNERLCSLFSKLKNDEFKIYVCSNAIRQTTKLYLLVLGLMEYVDGYISNEDVVCPKPHPEVYIKAMAETHAAPKETIVVEDSHIGITSAEESGAHLCRVKNSEETTEKIIYEYIDKVNNGYKKNTKWRGNNMNILIPMAGAGSRFVSAGYTFPKPLIEIAGKPMIQVVIENINIDGKYTFIVQQEHYDKYNLKYVLNMMTPKCNIVVVNGITEGAACTTLLAKEYINNDQPLLIANSDQYVEWNSSEFMYSITAGNIDGGILTFENTHSKWSYAKTDDDGYVVEVAEKRPISTHATVGIYVYMKGSDYVKYAEQMISKNIRTNNEFYVAPVYNEAIQDNKKFRTFNVEKMWGLGVPEDLEYFLREGPICQ